MAGRSRGRGGVPTEGPTRRRYLTDRVARCQALPGSVWCRQEVRAMPAVSEKPVPDRAGLREAVLHHVKYTLGSTLDQLSPRERFLAVARAVRDRMIDGMLTTDQRYQRSGAKRLYYLSMEFLIGRSLRNNLVNLGLVEV